MPTEEQVKEQALLENTAQGIFNQLREIENKREVYEKRWIWELLQNASDTAGETQRVKVEILQNESSLVFRHNGRPFEPSEVAHLICHGSTKKDTAQIGRFGTGFITTHLLSRKVKIKGVRSDNKIFDFDLDRNGQDPDEIKGLMEQSWDDYQNSLKMSERVATFTAEYEYAITSDVVETIKAGLSALVQIAPYVLGFSERIEEIKIESPDYRGIFHLSEESESNNSVIHKTIEERKGDRPEFHELIIVKGDEVEIAVKGRKKDGDSIEAEGTNGVPKLFLLFPLIGTEDLPFPAVINSRRFEATDNRDGVFLGRGDTEFIKRNKALIEEASGLVSKKLFSENSSNWKDMHILLDLSKPPEKDGFDSEWYTEVLKNIVGGLMDIPFVRTQSNDLISPKHSLIPYADGSQDKIEKVWDLCNCFANMKDRIPARELAGAWQKTLVGWNTLNLDISEIAFDLKKIGQRIAECGNLEAMKETVRDGIEVFGLLNGFYVLSQQLSKDSLLDDIGIFPNQKGILTKKRQLHKDQGIDEEIKDISERSGTSIRAQLLHSMVDEDIQASFPQKTQDEVLNGIVEEVRRSAKPGDIVYLEANISLFLWLVKHSEFERLEGYPLLYAKENSYCHLSREGQEKLLSPVEIWPETIRAYSSIFPQDHIISSEYCKQGASSDMWEALFKEKFVLTGPIYCEKTSISRDDMEYLLAEGQLEEEKEHKIEAALSTIAFLTMKDVGVMDTVRKSKEKARRFVEFLFRCVSKEDQTWDSPIEIECECGDKHKIFPALWISPLKSRQWVPVKKDKGEQPCAQNLASLLQDEPELLRVCSEDKPSRLLSRLSVSISDLIMRAAAKDEVSKLELDVAMASLVNTFKPSDLTEMAALAKSEPDAFLRQVKERVETTQHIHRNQQVGRLVERIFRETMGKEGFTVQRTGVGSDFAVEYDFVEDNQEVILQAEKGNVVYLFELKATTCDLAKMTLRQAKQATEQPAKYVLCVIPLNGEQVDENKIKADARFVMDIGNRLCDKVKAVENIKSEQEKVGGAFADDIEVEIGQDQIRFKISKHIWNAGLSFEDLKSFMSGV